MFEELETIVGLNIIRDMRTAGRNMVFLADAEGDTEIEIIEKPNADFAGNANLSIGFKTDDVEAKYKELDSKGMDVSEMIQPSPYVKFFFVKDPAGVNVQFMYNGLFFSQRGICFFQVFTVCSFRKPISGSSSAISVCEGMDIFKFCVVICRGIFIYKMKSKDTLYIVKEQEAIE